MCGETWVRREMFKSSIAAQSFSIKAHRNICLSFLNVSQLGFLNELKGGRYLNKIQLDCMPNPIQLLSKSARRVNKSPGYMQQTDKGENAFLKPCRSRLYIPSLVFHCKPAFSRANRPLNKQQNCNLETLCYLIPVYPTKTQLLFMHSDTSLPQNNRPKLLSPYQSHETGCPISQFTGLRCQDKI